MSNKTIIESHNTRLNALLDDVNALPEAEDLTSLLDEQETKLNTLLTTLDGKAGGSGGAAVEACTVEIVFNSPAEDMYFDTISPELEYTRLSYTSSELMSGVSFTVANNSFLVCSVGIGGEISGNIEAIDGALYLVRGSGTITTW